MASVSGSNKRAAITVNDETLLRFPCDFPIKMMGRDTQDFRDTARSLVEHHSGPLSDEAIKFAISRNGNFVSITITVQAQSQQQLDDIYRDVSSHEAVLMAL
jgi:putative lipoic acid-binding regulatory protein